MKFYLATLVASASAIDYETWANGPTFSLTYDAAKMMMKLTSKVPENTWLGLGFGEGMANVDMVVMQGKDNGIMRDLWSTTFGQPKADATDDWKEKAISKDGTMYSFAGYRSLSTGDATEDTVLECGKDYEFYWSGNDMTAEFTKHTKRDEIMVTFNADCSMSTTESSAMTTMFNGLLAASALVFMTI